jgi:hypothetical protein
MGNHAHNHSTSPAEPRRELALDDDALARLARDCWIRAEPLIEPTNVEAAARAAVIAAKRHHQHQEVRRIERDFSARTKRPLRRAANPLTHRQHWAVRLMAERLFDTSVYDPELRCVGACEKKPKNARPGWHCPAADDPTHAACGESLVFPYHHETHDGAGRKKRVCNQAKAAEAIVRGFACGGARAAERGDDCDFPCNGIHLTVSAVRQILTRFLEKH